MGVYCRNESQAIAPPRQAALFAATQSARYRNAAHCLQRQADHVAACIDQVEGPPVVVKLLQGTQGIGVVLAESARAAESVIEAFHGLEQNILIQQFIKESKGADIRALVVGRKVVAAMKRKAVAGEFRSNLHRGGRRKRSV